MPSKKKKSGKRNRKATEADVAAWMIKRISNRNELRQQDAAAAIKKRFGKRFVHKTDAGGLSIDRAVRDEFVRLTPDLVWNSGHRLWRKRTRVDEPTRAAATSMLTAPAVQDETT